MDYGLSLRFRMLFAGLAFVILMGCGEQRQGPPQWPGQQLELPPPVLDVHLTWWVYEWFDHRQAPTREGRPVTDPIRVTDGRLRWGVGRWKYEFTASPDHRFAYRWRDYSNSIARWNVIKGTWREAMTDERVHGQWVLIPEYMTRAGAQDPAADLEYPWVSYFTKCRIDGVELPSSGRYELPEIDRHVGRLSVQGRVVPPQGQDAE